jgi:alpha-glucosidase (family GH31 glycosyl hydrolase)
MIPTNNVRTVKMDPEEIGVYIKAGSIIARKYIRRMSALETLQDDYMLDVYLTQGNNQHAKSKLYLDDGETFNHATLKEYTLVEFEYIDGNIFLRTPH